MATVELDGRSIADWPSFHEECRKAFGFPDFYGRNMDAWADCLSNLRAEDGMTRFRLGSGEALTIEIRHAAQVRRFAPEILALLDTCIAELNEQYVARDGAPALSLVLH